MEVAQLVTQALEPVLLSLGFARTGAWRGEHGYWAYAKGDLEITFALDHRYPELEISLHDLPNKWMIDFWRLGEFLADPETRKLGSISLAEHRAAIELELLAAAIERHGAVLGHWNRDVAEHLNSRQTEDRDMGWRQERLRDALKLADTLWQAREFDRFARHLAAFESELSPATLKKLRYAEKHSK